MTKEERAISHEEILEQLGAPLAHGRKGMQFPAPKKFEWMKGVHMKEKAEDSIKDAAIEIEGLKGKILKDLEDYPKKGHGLSQSNDSIGRKSPALIEFSPPEEPDSESEAEKEKLKSKLTQITIKQVQGLLQGAGLTEKEAHEFAKAAVEELSSSDNMHVARKMIEKKLQSEIARQMLNQYSNPSSGDEGLMEKEKEMMNHEPIVVLEKEGDNGKIYQVLKKKGRTLVDNGCVHEFYVLEHVYDSLEDLLQRRGIETMTAGGGQKGNQAG